MKKIFLPILFTIFYSTLIFAQAEFYVDLTNSDDLENPREYLEYLIVEGDCLWNLADQFYSDPWLWPEIFNANPYIQDPHWIFYDNWLVIPEVYPGGEAGVSSGVKQVAEGETGALESAEDSGMDYSPEDKSSESTGSESKAVKSMEETALLVAGESDKDSDMDSSKKEEKKHREGCKCKESACGKPGFSIGLQFGTPFGAIADNQDGPNYGLFIGTPLGFQFGAVNVGLGAAILTYDFEEVYPGVGLIGSLCLNDLFKADLPVTLQLGGGPFYAIGGGLGAGVGGSVGIPLSDSPFSLKLYTVGGTYKEEDSDASNWGNAGAVLIYSF